MSNFEASVGASFMMPHPQGDIDHLWVIFAKNGNEVAIVNFNTFRRGADETVILDQGDHPFIRRKTTVTYSDSMIVESNLLHKLEETGKMLVPHAFCSTELLEMIQDGAVESEFTPLKILRFMEQSGEQDS